MIRIVTDGAADLPDAWQKQYGIAVCPINIRFGERTFIQYEELDTAGFYRMVAETGMIPKTSQPSPHQFLELYKKIAQPGDTILSIHITSKLSGTYASAVQAAREAAGTIKVLPFDSMVGSIGIGFMCREARRMADRGVSPENILEALARVREQVRAYFTLDSLDFARMSGRVGAMQATLASLMNIKPITVLKDGEVKITDKVRTRQASVARIVEMASKEFQDRRCYLGVLQANDLASGKALLTAAAPHFNLAEEPVLVDLSISVAANLGPGTVGLLVYPLD